MNQATDTPFDVAIVGFGPVGASLAALLGRRGRRVLVVDKSEEVYPLPRAFALDHEAMRTFQEIGIAGALAAHMTPYRPTLYQGSDGHPIQHFDMGPSPYPLAWAPAYTFNQPALEASLRSAVAAMPNVEVHLGCEMTDLIDSGEAVTIKARNRDGSSSTFRASYAVACDGGASPARKRLGLPLKSLDFDEPWIVVDMHIAESKLPELPTTNIQYCNPQRPCTYVVGPGTHRRWEFLLLPHEADQRVMPDEAIWALLAPWLSPHDARIWRAATYRFHAVVLERWRQGSILLAGDSAHQMPPFLAQGMCQGLRDAINLAWKLDWVVTGRAPDSLLDTFGEERGPQVEDVTATVKRLGQIICERDPVRATQRDQLLRDAQGGKVTMQLRQSLLPGVHHGLIDRDEAPAGSPFPQPTCRASETEEAQMMDDLLPREFLLVLRSAAWSSIDEWRPQLDDLGAHVVVMGCDASDRAANLRETDGVLEQWFERYACSAALVRPDHIVYGIAKTVGDVGALLAKASQQMAMQSAVQA